MSHSDSNVILGSTLLDIEEHQDDYRPIWHTGIRSIDAHFKDIFISGKVIGIGHVEDDGSASLVIQLLAQHLLASSSKPAPLSTSASAAQPTQPSLFIISPPSSTIITDLHSNLTTTLHQPTHKLDPETTPLSLLSTIQLLQYFDLPGLAESLSEVTATLFSHSPAKHTSTTPPTPPPTILLLHGLPSTLTSTLRRTSPTQTNAILANLLRTLTHLSRTSPHLLVLLTLDIQTHSSAPPISPSTSTSTSTSPPRPHLTTLTSAFSPPTPQSLHLLTPPNSTGAILAHALDLTLLLHPAPADNSPSSPSAKTPSNTAVTIVEVVKDRTAHHRGDWCLWVHQN